MKRLAIIPARSGSKGLKNKNIIDLCGKPLMAYSIEAALQSELFARVIVTTDSEVYANIAEKYGAEAMFRGKELSNDTASSFMVVKDVLEKAKDFFDYFMLLQPTSPMRNASHIQEAIELFDKNINKFDFLVSMKQSKCPSSQIKPIETDGSLKHFGNDTNYRRQNYKEYTANGAIYVAKPYSYLAAKDFYGVRGMAYIMSQIDSIDIDTQLDYELAVLCMRKKLKEFSCENMVEKL